jgi:succinate-acetate transporter protein
MKLIKRHVIMNVCVKCREREKKKNSPTLARQIVSLSAEFLIFWRAFSSHATVCGVLVESEFQFLLRSAHVNFFLLFAIVFSRSRAQLTTSFLLIFSE